MVRPGRQGDAEVRVVTVGVVVEGQLRARRVEQAKTGVEGRADRPGVHVHDQRPCLGQRDGVEVHVRGAEGSVADGLRHHAMDGAVAEGAHVIGDLHLIARLVLGHVINDRSGGLCGPDDRHRRRTGTEVQVVVDQQQIRQIQSGKGRDVSDPVAGQVQLVQGPQACNQRNVGELIVPQVEEVQSCHTRKRHDVGDLVCGQVEVRHLHQAGK